MSFCFWFFHKWGEWKSVEPCIEKRECLRCGEKEYKKDHDWSMWTSEPGLEFCSRERTCKRCGEKETEDLHNYPATQQVCGICGKQLDNFMNV